MQQALPARHPFLTRDRIQVVEGSAIGQYCRSVITLPHSVAISHRPLGHFHGRLSGQASRASAENNATAANCGARRRTVAPDNPDRRRKEKLHRSIVSARRIVAASLPATWTVCDYGESNHVVTGALCASPTPSGPEFSHTSSPLQYPSNSGICTAVQWYVQGQLMPVSALGGNPESLEV